MRMTTVRRLTTAGVLALLAGLTFGALPAFGTEAHVDANTGGSGSSVHIFDNDDNADVVSVQVSGPLVIVTDTGPGGITPDDATCAVINAQNISCPLVPPPDPPPADPFDPIDRIDFQGNGGPDSISTTTTFETDAQGGDGPDSLTGGSGEDELQGDDGVDTLSGLGGEDFLSGDDGNDTLLGGEGDDGLDGGGNGTTTGGTDVLDGGPGRDFGGGFFRDAAVSLSLDDVANDGFPGENDNLIAIEDTEGGDGDDVITGNDGPNELFSDDGNDVVRGLGGSDSIFAGDDDDLVDGGAAADELDCGGGVDTALIDPDDELFGVNCERTGARSSLDTVLVDSKGVAKVPVSCPAAEAATCEGKVKLLLNGKSIGKGKFKVPVGKTKKAKVKLSKKGKKTLKQNGGTVLAQASVETKLGGGTSTTEDAVLLRQKASKGGKK